MAQLSCDNNAICYVLLVLWMTSCFHIVGLMGQKQSYDIKFGQVRQVAAPVDSRARHMG